MMWALYRLPAVLLLELAASFSVAHADPAFEPANRSNLAPPTDPPPQSCAAASASMNWATHGAAGPCYSPLRYWAPGLARVYDHLHGPRMDPYPPDRHPEITPTMSTLKFACPAVEGAATVFTPPTPPFTSVPRR
jgi:hypothetical protein